MKSIKFLFAGVMALILSLCVSCSNNSDGYEESPAEEKFGSISIKSGSSDRFIDDNVKATIEKADVTISGYGMDPVTVKDVTITNGAGTVTVDKIPVGVNRVVTIQAKKTVDNVLSNIEGMVLSAVIDAVGTDKTTDVTVNWDTTAEGNLYAELISEGYDVRSFSRETAKSYLPKNVEANLIDTKTLAKDIKAGKTPKSEDYVKVSRTVTFTSDSASEEVSVWINDNNSSKLSSVVKGVNTITGVVPGKHTMYFIFKGENVLLEKEIDTTEADVNIEDSIKLQITKPRLEDGNGNGFTDEEMTFDSAKTVYLECRAYEDEKIPEGITVYYTLDGTDPKEVTEKLTYDSTKGIEISKNTTIKAYSTHTYLYDSDTVTIEPKVRCASPVLKDAEGKDITDPTFTEVTTVYLSAAEGAEIKYYVNDSEEPAVYDASKGITLSEKQTIKAVASIDGYADSKAVTFGVNVTLPIGKLTITGTTSSARRFMDKNTISITSDSGIEGIKIIYTKDGSTPGIDKYGEMTGSEYAEPFVIMEDSVITAIAYKENWQDSEIAGPVTFTRATKLSAPVITGETSFVSETPVTITFPGTDVNGTAVASEGVKVYYSTDDADTTADAIIAKETVYTEPFEISATTHVRAVAVCEDYVTSDVADLQFAITEGVEKITFTSTAGTDLTTGAALPVIDMTGKTCWVRIWTEKESDSTWTQATITDAVNGVATFNMPTDKTTFLVVIASGNTTSPDWEAISYTDSTTGETVDMNGRIFYQTNENGISYYAGTRAYSAAFKSYTPATQVKYPSIGIDTDGYVTLACATTSARIFYTEDGTDPVDGSGNPVTKAVEYSAPFKLAETTTLLKVAAYKEHFTTSEITKYSTTGDLDVTWYVGVPATISLPDEDDKSNNRDITVTGMNIAFDGNGYSWKEIAMTKCENSSTDSVVWYKLTTQFNNIDGTTKSSTTYQPRITVSGQTKTVLYYHGTANGYCNSAVNASVDLAKKVVVIDGTNMEDWNFYTSDTADTTSGSAKYFTQDWAIITDGKVQFTDTDPGYN